MSEHLSKNQIKWVRSLQQKKQRDAEGVFVAEGHKCVEELRGAFELVLMVTPDNATEVEIAQMSNLRTPQGVIGVFKRRGDETKGERQETVFEYHDTICRNVANRVKRLQDFARSNDVVIFVGGKKSSNAKVLFQHCLEVNASTVFVSSVEDLTDEIIRNCHSVERVGICGATSTPKWLMEQIRSRVEETSLHP